MLTRLRNLRWALGKHNLGTHYRRITLLHNLFPTCTSCGIRLQLEDPNGAGWYRPPDQKKKPIKYEDTVFAKVMNELSDEDKRLVTGVGNNENIANSGSTDGMKAEKKINSRGLQCVRCREALYRSKFSWDQLPLETLDKVISGIPPTGTLVYVISAVDFPFSLDKQVFKYRNAKEVYFLVTKCDLLFPTVELSNRYGATFFKDYLSRDCGADLEKVFCTSGVVDWNMKLILEKLPQESYFVGNVNCGKSTLIQSLLYVSEREKPLHLSKRERKYLSKQDVIQKNPFITKSYLLRERKKQKNKIKSLNGPGASYMPGFTRDLMVHTVDGKTIVDAPGFAPEPGASGWYEYVDPSAIKTLTKGVSFYKKNTYDSHYDTLKGDQVLTVGGLFYLATPKNTLFQIKNCINMPFHVFLNIDKALLVLRDIEQNPSMQNFFVVNKLSLDVIQKFFVPPFYGSIDLVVKDLGHINVTPVGAKHTNEPLVVYVPKGVQVLVRQPIMKYISRTLSGRDKNGNVLRKDNLKSKSVTHLLRYTGKEPLTSMLIPSSSLDGMQDISDFVNRSLDNQLKYDEHSKVDDSNRYAYWLPLS